MAWTSWILLSACFLALYDLAKKASVRNNAVLPVLLCSTSFGCAAFLLGLLVTGHFGSVVAALDGRVWLFGFLKSCLVGVSWIFTFTALRTLPITIATPIRSTSPAVVFLIALFLYGEVPTVAQAFGMASVFAGYWAFSWAGRHEGIDFFHNRAVGFAVAGMICAACSAVFDKFIFQIAKIPIEPTQLVFQVGLIVVYAVGVCGMHLARRVHLSSLPSAPFVWRRTIPLVGIFLTITDWLYFHGLAMPEVPISVGALLRRLSVAITFVLGAIFFRETNLRRKGLALALVLVGIFLLARG